MSAPDDDALDALAAELGAALLARGQQLAAAESCTGGWVAMALTAIPGSSRWFERGFVTYSNAAKSELLGVAPELIARHGAVSEQTVTAMAQGARAHSHAAWSLAVSGIAGPDGGSEDKPVGTVWFAWAGPDGRAEAEVRHFSGDRRAVRAQAAEHAIKGLLARVNSCI